MKAKRIAAAVAAFLAGVTPALSQTPEPPETTDAAALYAASCSACHGRSGRGVSVYPSLQDRTPEYLAEKLEIYRAGTSIGPNSGLMIPNARDLTDDQIAALSSYISATFR